MFEIAELNRFPLTGARAEPLTQSLVDHNGLVGDRYFLLHSPTADSNVSTRVGQRQEPRLAQIATSYDERGDFLEVEFPDGSLVKAPVVDRIDNDHFVDEFGDLTPIIDNYPEESKAFAGFLGKETIRLCQKSGSWLFDADNNYIKPEARAVAPLHIVSSASVAELQKRDETGLFGAERFRANIVLDTDEQPFVENKWLGRTLKIGNLLIAVHRPTKRCPVPGYDQLSGENKKDVPKLYRALEKTPEDNKPIFGVYGYPMLNLGETRLIGLGDQAEVL